MITDVSVRHSYWQATRSFSAPASIVPVVVGATVAVYLNGPAVFNLVVFLLTLVGAVLAHFGANVINDYFDFIYGIDTEPDHGSGVLTAGLLKPKQMLAFGVLLLLAAGACGVALYSRAPHAVLILALVGLACAVLYPALLKRFALGDFLIITAFGVGLTVGAYVVQAGPIASGSLGYVVLISLPVASLVDAILHANNLRDIEADTRGGVRTLATILSPRAGRLLLAALIFFPVLFVVAGVAGRILPVWSLASLIALPALVQAYKTGNVPLTAQSHLAFGLPYALSFLIRPLLGH